MLEKYIAEASASRASFIDKQIERLNAEGVVADRIRVVERNHVTFIEVDGEPVARWQVAEPRIT